MNSTRSDRRPTACPAAVWGAPVILALLFMIGCGAPPARGPGLALPDPPPLDILPADAALTGVIHPETWQPSIAALGLEGALPGGPWLDRATLVGLGFHPNLPIWFALRSGPVLAVRRAAEDAERVLDDAAREPMVDPRLSPADPFARWLDAHPLPPAWLHLRLVGHPAPLEAKAPPSGPGAYLEATYGALAVAGPGDPIETLAVTLDADPATARATRGPDGEGHLTVYRLLDAPLPTIVTHSDLFGVTIDVIWDRDLGPGALVDGLKALRISDGETLADAPYALGPGEMLRVHVHHERLAAMNRMLGEVDALHAVVGQGQVAAGARDTLRDGRVDADILTRLMAPVGRLLTRTVIAVSQTDGRFRARLEGEATTPGLAGLGDGIAAADHGVLARSMTSGPGAILTLALAPQVLGRGLSPHVGPPDRPLPALIDDIEGCGPTCALALWSTLAYARDLPATVAELTEQAPLRSALADATGGAYLRSPAGVAAAVGHRPPATLERAAWAPIMDAAGLDARWIVGDRAVLVVGGGSASQIMAEAARAPATTDAAALRFTLIDPLVFDTPPLRIDGAVSFDRSGVVIDAVIDGPKPPAP